MSKARITKFYDVEEFRKYLLAHPEAIGLSPGGASNLLGVSRQRLHQMIAQGFFRAWYLYEKPFDGLLKRAVCIYISKEDLLAYLETYNKVGGRPRKVA